MKTSWDIFAYIIWLPVCMLMTAVFGGAGTLAALFFFPLVWVLWVNLREHWWQPDDRDGE